MSTVFLHGFQDRLGLEAGCLESGSSDVALVRVRRDAEQSPTSIIVPVWRVQPAECGDEGAATIVRNRLGQLRDFPTCVDEFEIINEKFDTGARHSNTSFKSIHAGLRTKVKGHCG